MEVFFIGKMDILSFFYGGLIMLNDDIAFDQPVCILLHWLVYFV